MYRRKTNADFKFREQKRRNSYQWLKITCQNIARWLVRPRGLWRQLVGSPWDAGWADNGSLASLIRRRRHNGVQLQLPGVWVQVVRTHDRGKYVLLGRRGRSCAPLLLGPARPNDQDRSFGIPSGRSIAPLCRGCSTPTASLWAFGNPERDKGQG